MKKTASFAIRLLFLWGIVITILTGTSQKVSAEQKIISVSKLNPSTVEIICEKGQRIILDFYSDNIFRFFQDNANGIVRDPKAEPDARILVQNPRSELHQLVLNEENDIIRICTERISFEMDKKTSLFTVTDLKNNLTVIRETAPVLFQKGRVTVTLEEKENEYFYGGGVQNGRFSHKGKCISIENQNSWTDGGVASPAPFYWSTGGYGVFFYTFKKGSYDFGATRKGIVQLSHETDYLDVFYMIGDGCIENLNNFYQLTGHPVLLPKFGFYEGHLNAYNRDYWKESEKGILFEDGKYYKESQKDNGGIKESLNGESGNYQFSARAVIDRYKAHDMPLGWILPNDGYGAGYGQTKTLDGNIQNLKAFGDYARKNGVEIGLWTQSNLHPQEGVEALLQRDIVKEVRDAGVRILKTDVAWVGAGYSFGLNGVSDVSHIMPYYGNNARPFIISLDGWAGTQRYAAIWTGDQTGGEWEYIRFHIPTYIGSGLSGQPNITSDNDGIFGGKNPMVNIRDFQWKTWSLMQLNMDGWGRNEKYPHALGEPATSINRMYLKLKSALLPYTYSIAKEAVNGLPLIRAMFLEYPNKYTYGKSTQYQYMFGPYFLIAPIYQDTQADKKGNDIRDGIYIPEGEWIDYFTGDIYTGNCIVNNYDTPIWKLPVFVKRGAIIPMTCPNNNVSEINHKIRIFEVYPYKKSQFSAYDDDGFSEAYKAGHGATTLIESELNDKNEVRILIHPTEGSFENFLTEKETFLRIHTTRKPKTIEAKIGNKKIKLAEVFSNEDFQQQSNCIYYENKPEWNLFATPESEFSKTSITGTPILHIKLAATDITHNSIHVKIKGYEYRPVDNSKMMTGKLQTPHAQVLSQNTEAYCLKPTWAKISNADYYEIENRGMLYTGIRNNFLSFNDLLPDTEYAFKIRAVNKEGHSDWYEFKSTTKRNPLEFAIHNIEANCSVRCQEGFGAERLTDFAETGDMWHTKYGAKAIPFELVLDLKTLNKLDKFQYLGRKDAGNGTFLKGSVFISMDRKSWIAAGDFQWERNGDVKVFKFENQPTARYIKICVSQAVGNYGSAREIYVFKVPGSESYLPGDINNDRKINENDLTSYTNYCGLRRGDSDFEGYISNGDINRNNLIDAYDISNVTTRLEGGIPENVQIPEVAGEITVQPSKKYFHKDDVIEILVKGKNLEAVNALSFALPYDASMYEFVGVEALGMKKMENLTYDRLHSNGNKSLYPTYVNIGNKDTLEGTFDLFIIKMKARKNGTFKLQIKDGILVNKLLDSKKF